MRYVGKRREEYCEIERKGGGYLRSFIPLHLLDFVQEVGDDIIKRVSRVFTERKPAPGVGFYRHRRRILCHGELSKSQNHSWDNIIVSCNHRFITQWSHESFQEPPSRELTTVLVDEKGRRWLAALRGGSVPVAMTDETYAGLEPRARLDASVTKISADAPRVLTDGGSDDSITKEAADCPKIQIRILALITAEVEAPKGLRLKELLEDYYGEEITPSRLYPNLDKLVDRGLIEKGRKDKRTNSYSLTSQGKEVLEYEIDWLVARVRGGEADV